MARLGDYVKIKTGKLDANESSENGQYPFFTCSVEPLKIDTYSYDCECVLVAGNGDLNVKYYNGKFDAYQRTYIIESKDKKILSVPYLYCFLDGYVEELRKQSIGGVIKYIKLGNLTEAQIPMCSITEQNEIVENLNKVNTLIILRKQQLSKLDELVKSRFIELFGDIASYPQCVGVPLGTICTTLSGGTPTTKVPEYYEGDIPWISTPYLGNNHINGSSAKAYITEEAIKNSATHLIPANTIMFGIRVGVGKSSVIDEPMCANQDIVALMGIDTSKYNLLFVKHVLDAYQSHFDSIKKGATILGITTEDLKKVLIPTADIEIQNQFAAFVEQTDKSKFEIQQSLEKLETLKKALMQKYFG